MDGSLNQQCWYECPQCDYKNKYPSNLNYHMKCHTRNQRIKCPFCSFSSNFKFCADRHLELHHFNMATPSQNNKIMDTTNPNKLVALCDDFDLEDNSFHSSMMKKTSIEVETEKIEMEEADCRKRITQCKEDIRKARFSMAELRVIVKQQKEIRSEKEKQKEILSHCLEIIKINNQKLSDLSMWTKALETLRSNIRDTNRRKLQFELQLRALQLKDLELKRCLNESVDEVVVIKSNDEAIIKRLKTRFKEIKNELEVLREKERILFTDVEGLSQSLQVVEKVPNQVVQGLQSELEELAMGIETFLQDKTEEALNQLIISTEEKIRNIFTLKNNLLDIMFLKKSIRGVSKFKL